MRLLSLPVAALTGALAVPAGRSLVCAPRLQVGEYMDFTLSCTLAVTAVIALVM